MAASQSPAATKKNWVKGGVIAAIVLAFIVGIVAIYVRHKDEPATTPTTPVRTTKAGRTVAPPVETDASGDEESRPSRPPVPKGDPDMVTLTGNVPIVVNVPKPRYECRLIDAPTSEATSRPAIPRSATTPKKTDTVTVRVIVFNGLVNPLEVRYRNAETDPGRLAEEGATKRQTIEVGEETAVDGVPVGEYLTVTEKDAAGKVVGTLDCKIDPDRGPVRMLHVRETMMYYPRKR